MEKLKLLEKAVYTYPKGVAYKTSSDLISISSGSFSVDEDTNYVYDNITGFFVYIEDRWLKTLNYEEYKEYLTKS